MDRRELLRSLIGGTLTAGALVPLTSTGAVSRPSQGGVSPRIAMTTACLRDRIATHLAMQEGMKAVTPQIQMYDAPQYIRDTFGIRHVEIWSPMIPEQTDAYCREIQRRTARAGCVISNIQLDGPYNLSSSNAAERSESIAYAKTWIRRTASMGSPRMRVNIDDGKPDRPLDEAALAKVLRELQDYASANKVQLLIENHIGNSKKIATVAELLRVAGDPRMGAVLDWGNSDAANFDVRLADFRLLFPYLAFVSAKGLHFDRAGKHIEYPIETIVRATEAYGYRGIYSIELYVEENFPDPIMGVKSMIKSIQSNLVS
jgi:sugar phosphate isomerase/epimerase